jgi:hypothetical protein
MDAMEYEVQSYGETVVWHYAVIACQKLPGINH